MIELHPPYPLVNRSKISPVNLRTNLHYIIAIHEDPLESLAPLLAAPKQFWFQNQFQCTGTQTAAWVQTFLPDGPSGSPLRCLLGSAAAPARMDRRGGKNKELVVEDGTNGSGGVGI